MQQNSLYPEKSARSGPTMGLGHWLLLSVYLSRETRLAQKNTHTHKHKGNEAKPFFDNSSALEVVVIVSHTYAPAFNPLTRGFFLESFD
jgi:hypothetical protein